jgi:lambda family phage tail tape measure protein
MAEQILKVKLVADTAQAETALKLFASNTKSAGAGINSVYKSVNVETDKIAYDIEVAAYKVENLKKAFQGAKAAIVSDESGTLLASKYVEVTKNILAAEASLSIKLAQINRDRLDFSIKEELEANRIRIASKRADTIAAFEDLAAKEKEQADLTKFYIQANYNSRKVMYANLMREMDEADAARAAKEKERLASISTRAPQAGRDDRGYVPFAMGTVGGNRAADLTTMQKLAASSAYSPDAEKLKIARGFSALSLMGSANNKAAIDPITESLSKQNTVLDESIRKHKSLGTHIAEVIGIYRIYNAAINLTEQALLSIPKALIELQSTTASLTATFGSFAGATRELAFLNEEATRTGIAITTLRESYSQASASFIMAGESAETTRNIFRDINTVATTLHLNADKVSSVFLALSQMFNKGKVQAEELTKQLSQTLPGITNQTAKALGLSAAQLGESMKKGLITAHEAVQLMSKQIAETFGGEAFNRATEGLNASLGRLSTAWTLFAESMGKVTESTMKAFVDGATSTINTLTSFTSQTEKATTAFNMLLAALSGAAMLTSIAAVEKLVLAIKGLELTLTGGGIRLAAAAVTTLGAAFYLSGKQADEASKSLDKYLEVAARKQRGEVAPLGGIAIQKPEDNEAYKYAIKQEALAVKEYQQALKASGEGLDRATTKYYKDRIQLAKGEAARVYGEALAQPAEAITKETTNASEEIAKAHIKFLEITGKKVEAARLKFLKDNEKDIEKLRQAASEGDEKAITALLEINEAYLKAGEETTTRSKNLKETYKATFEDIRNSASLIQADLTEALGSIDILYQQNAMSIETYFSQKIQLQETDLAVQKEMLNQELQLAYAQKDKIKIQKLNGELIKAETDANKLATKTIIEKTNAEREYANILANINAEYAKTFGATISTVEATDAAEQKFLATNGAYILQLSIAADKGDELAAKRLKQLYALKDSAVIDEQLNDLATKRNALAAEYDATIQRIADRTTAGFPDIWGTASDEALAKKRAGMAEIEAKQQEILSSQGAVPSLSDNAKKEVAKTKEILEDLKGKSGYIAEQMSKSFNDSFSNAFTGFIAGTDSASKAFSNFATSMIGSIQRILAQKMAEALLSSIITPALSSIGSGFMGLFSSGQSAAFTDTFSKSGTDFWGAGATKIWPNANGGVFSGAGISAYSGSVVSSPTIFPFAKGTGLMGEAGPEAILPLTRNSKGKLGVVADSTGQSSGNVYNIEVTVQSSKDEKPADTGQKIAEAMMRTIAKQEIGAAARPGNSLNRTTKFG